MRNINSDDGCLANLYTKDHHVL